MKYFSILLIVLSFFASCKEKKAHKDKVIFDRMEVIYQLKSDISKTIWPTFNEKKYDLPLIHYMDSFAYVANPTDKFLKMFKSELVHETPALKIYKTIKLPDNDAFHMETILSFGDDGQYDHKSPFMKCSSFELTKKTITDVESTELWMTMVIHEYFHGFQNKHPAFLKHFETLTQVSEDSLKQVYKSNPWFKASVDKENDLLLQALAAENIDETKGYIDDYFQLRTNRRKETLEKLKLDIEKYESIYETMEGTARYVEFGLYQQFANGQKDQKLSKSDPRYGNLKYFKNYKIEKDPWLYKSDKTAYFYATGFNMVRLLDKLTIKYKSNLFKENFSIEEQLKYYRFVGIVFDS